MANDGAFKFKYDPQTFTQKVQKIAFDTAIFYPETESEGYCYVWINDEKELDQLYQLFQVEPCEYIEFPDQSFSSNRFKEYRQVKTHKVIPSQHIEDLVDSEARRIGAIAL